MVKEKIKKATTAENRRKAVEYAIASSRLEGATFTEEELAEFEKLASRDLTYEEFRKRIFEKIAEERVNHPEYFRTHKE